MSSGQRLKTNFKIKYCLVHIQQFQDITYFSVQLQCEYKYLYRDEGQ